MSEKDVIKETKPRMETVIEDFRRKLATIRTGRAAVSLLDNIVVDYYGTPTPLNQMASVHAPEPQMLTVQPWDQSQVAVVEKAIRAAAEEAALSKRVLFLSRSQKVFHLWHVVHKPFSYTFAVLALIHIGLQFVLGYF